jgi:hypothetical protein
MSEATIQMMAIASSSCLSSDRTRDWWRLLRVAKVEKLNPFEMNGADVHGMKRTERASEMLI